MSIEALAIVLNHSKAKGATKIVLMGIANHLNPDNDGAWPSQSRLAKYANISDRAVRDSIQQLVELGEIHYEVNAGNSSSQYKPNRYWLTLNCPPECDKSPGHNVGRVEVFDSQGGSFQQSGWKPTSVEPLKNRNLEPNISPNEFDIKFNEFWKIYPRKVKIYDAKKAFTQALQITDLDEVMDGAKRLAADPNKPITKYLPYPATWLRAGGWKDEPYPEKVLTKDEAKEAQAVVSREKLDADKEATREFLEAEARRDAELAASPPARCEHDHIKAICRECQK